MHIYVDKYFSFIFKYIYIYKIVKMIYIKFNSKKLFLIVKV